MFCLCNGFWITKQYFYEQKSIFIMTCSLLLLTNMFYKFGSCDHNLNVIYCNIRYLFMQLPSDIYRHTDCENVRITESDILYYIWL